MWNSNKIVFFAVFLNHNFRESIHRISFKPKIRVVQDMLTHCYGSDGLHPTVDI